MGTASGYGYTNCCEKTSVLMYKTLRWSLNQLPEVFPVPMTERKLGHLMHSITQSIIRYIACKCSSIGDRTTYIVGLD